MALTAAQAARIDRHSAMFKELAVGTALRTAQTDLDTAEAKIANLGNIAFGAETCSSAGGTGTVTLTGFGTPTAVVCTLDDTTDGPNESEITVTPGTNQFTYTIVNTSTGAALDCSATNAKFYYIAVR